MMVEHIILWKLKSEYDDNKKSEIMQNIKTGLEGLKGQIEGLEYVSVQKDELSSSTCYLMLHCKFADESALKYYKTHPAHQNVANTYVRPFVEVRLCIDYED